MIMGLVRRSAGIALALALGLAPLPAAAAPAPWAVFGAREVRSDDLSMFTKWIGATGKNSKESMSPDRMCSQNRPCLAEWQKLTDGLASAERRAQLSRVNEAMNRSPYIEDI